MRETFKQSSWQNHLDHLLALYPTETITLEMNPDEVTLVIHCKARKNLERFVCDMAVRWLVPGSRLTIERLFSATENDHKLIEIVLTGQDLAQVRAHFPVFKEELAIGIKSSYHERRILECKGLTLGEKEIQVRSSLYHRLNRFPGLYDSDLFELMNEYCIRTDPTLRASKSAKEQERLLCTLYRLQKEVKLLAEEDPTRRNVALKMIFSKERDLFGTHSNVAICVAAAIPKGEEPLTLKQILSAIDSSTEPRNHFSLLTRELGHTLFYLELEESRTLLEEQERIVRKLERREEKRLRPLFMPRNEEEIFRAAVRLASEIKYLRDLPQVQITFEKQTLETLVFTLVIAQVKKGPSLSALLDTGRSAYTIEIEKVRNIGMVRRRIPKEIGIIRAHLPVHNFLREDGSVDVYRARTALLKELTVLLGEVRDYNGGILSKQDEILSELIYKIGTQHRFFIENFFHSIEPTDLRTSIPVSVFEKLILNLLEENKKRTQLLSLPPMHAIIFNCALIPLNIEQRHATFEVPPNRSGYLIFGSERQCEDIYKKFLKNL